jgi:hypothetical protein
MSVDSENPELLATLQVQIAFKDSGEGTLTYGGTTVPCLGKPSVMYPVDSIIENIEGVQYQGDYGKAYKFKLWKSNDFQDDNGNPYPMPWAVKLWPDRGIFIHEGADNLKDNPGPSSGCVHLAAPNAQNFYNWITARTRIQVSYPWSATLIVYVINQIARLLRWIARSER